MGQDPEGRNEPVFIRRWMSFFEVDPLVCTITWSMLAVPVVPDEEESELNATKPEHLLWALLFLKKYGDEHEMAWLAGGNDGPVDEKTFRKCAQLYVRMIAGLIDQVVGCLNNLRSAFA